MLGKALHDALDLPCDGVVKVSVSGDHRRFTRCDQETRNSMKRPDFLGLPLQLDLMLR